LFSRLFFPIGAQARVHAHVALLQTFKPKNVLVVETAFQLSETAFKLSETAFQTTDFEYSVNNMSVHFRTFLRFILL
jgi:hypothetical protein